MMKIIKQIKTSYVQNLRKVESERPTLVLIRLIENAIQIS